MTRQIRRTKQVRDDIIEIYAYIAQRSVAGAERVLDAIESSIRKLADGPVIGRLWQSPDRRLEGLRVALALPYRSYLIFFRVSSDAVEVYRVVHGARELDRIVDDIEIEFDDD